MDFLTDANIATVVTMFLVLLSTFLGAKYAVGEKKRDEIQNLFNSVFDATKDRKVTAEEVDTIKKAFNAVLGKKEPE